jgi:glycine/D-amino acid oxidase-like deaminating enzyme
VAVSSGGSRMVRGRLWAHTVDAAELARRAGAVATGVAMTDAQVAGGRIVRVRTTVGDLHPGVVVFATGLAPRPWVWVPQRLVKGHLGGH